MHWRRRPLPGLMALIALMVVLVLSGCSEDIDATIADDVNNRSFTFDDGAVLHPGLENDRTTLCFTNSDNNFALADFTLTSRGVQASGRARFQPCSLTVEANESMDTSFTTGPQVGDVLQLTTCDFDLKSNTLILGNGTIIGISSPAVDASGNCS